MTPDIKEIIAIKMPMDSPTIKTIDHSASTNFLLKYFYVMITLNND